MSWDLSNASETGVQDGDYVVTCTEAEVKQTKSGSGEYIKAKFEAETGETFFHMFNVKNENKKAVDIGLGQLKKFLRVAGKSDLSKASVDDLVNLRVTIRVKNEDSDYGVQARIKDFKPAPKRDASPFG